MKKYQPNLETTQSNGLTHSEQLFIDRVAKRQTLMELDTSFMHAAQQVIQDDKDFYSKWNKLSTEDRSAITSTLCKQVYNEIRA